MTHFSVPRVLSGSCLRRAKALSFPFLHLFFPPFFFFPGSGYMTDIMPQKQNTCIRERTVEGAERRVKHTSCTQTERICMHWDLKYPPICHRLLRYPYSCGETCQNRSRNANYLWFSLFQVISLDSIRIFSSKSIKS